MKAKSNILIKTLSAAVFMMMITLCISFFSVSGSAANEEIFTCGDYIYYVENGNAVIKDYLGHEAEIINIPFSLDGYIVTKLEAYSFYGCKATEIYVPNCVKVIGDGAFFCCNNLRKISVPFVGSTRKQTILPVCNFGYIFGYSAFAESSNVLCSTKMLKKSARVHSATAKSLRWS